MAIGGVAEAHRLFKHCLEHRRQIAGRGVDDLQYLRRRGLLLQCLTLLGDQSRVLDRDDGLIGEGADEFDLPVGKWFAPAGGRARSSRYLIFAQQRHAERRSLLAQA